MTSQGDLRVSLGWFSHSLGFLCFVFAPLLHIELACPQAASGLMVAWIPFRCDCDYVM